MYIHFFSIKRKSSTYLILSSLTLLLLASLTLNIYFSDIIDIYITRQQQAEDSEGSSIARGFTMLFEYIKFLYADIPIIGYGIGAGTSGGVALLEGERGITLAEYDLSRIIFELGSIFGLLFIFYRYYLSIYLIIDSIKS